MDQREKFKADTAVAVRRFANQFQQEAKSRSETGKLGFAFRPAERRAGDWVIEMTYASQKTAHRPILHQYRLFASELITMTDEKMRETARNALDSFRQTEMARELGLA